MKNDTVKQYAKLRQQLVEEKSQLESRLSEINAVLGSESAITPAPQASPSLESPAQPVGRRGRKAKGDNSLSLREAVLKALSHGPLARKELVGAVENVGYVFNTKNPLNSIGSVLYAKNGPVKSQGGKFFVEGGSSPANGVQSAERTPGKKKRKMSPEGRLKIAAAAKARWAKHRAGK